MNITNIRIDDIRLDGGTQTRTGISEATVSEYADAILAGAVFPAVVVFFDGTDYFLGDGFHRLHGHRQAGHAEILADVRTGTRRDALLFAVGANAEHGLRRTNDDKRKAVRTLLEDAEWGQWTDREMARRAGVSHNFVSTLRKQMSLSSDDSDEPASLSSDDSQKAERRYTTKHGTEATMDTANIGKTKPTVATARDKPTSGPATTTTPDDDGPSAAELLDDMHADVRRAEARVAELEKALKDGGKEQVVALLQRLDQADRARDDAMTAAKRWQDRAERYERTLSRIGKAVGDRDLDQVAARVEAMARSVRGKVAA